MEGAKISGACKAGGTAGGASGGMVGGVGGLSGITGTVGALTVGKGTDIDGSGGYSGSVDPKGFFEVGLLASTETC